MPEKDLFYKPPNTRITFWATPETKKSLEMIAAKENRSISAVVRSAVEKYMVIDSYTDNLDLLDGIVGRTITLEIRNLEKKIAAYVNRLNIITAAAYYTNISAISDLLDRDRYSSFEKIENMARRKAIDYANTKSFDGLEGFLDDERIKQLKCEMVGKKYEPTGNDNFNDFDFTNYDY